MIKVAVIGGGAWGTALALHAARAGHQVTLWARNAEWAAGRINPRLPNVPLPDTILVTSVLPASADAVLMAVPTQHVRAVLTGWCPPGPTVLCMKGIEAATRLLPSELMASLHPGVPACVLTGPNFAAEVAAGLPAAAVVAGPGRDDVIALLATPGFRLYGNDDLVGAQLGGAAKNVMAIAAGVVMGRSLGENARAALITRGVAELARLVVALGGRAETVAGLSGLGDLLLTCTGGASRNYAWGLALGAGRVPGGSGVVEGVATAPALLTRAAGVELPICGAVAALLAGSVTVDDAIAALLARPLRSE